MNEGPLLERNVVTLAARVTTELPVLNKFSNYRKLQRVIAYCLRFINSCRRSQSKHSNNLSCEELEESSVTILKAVQVKTFQPEIMLLKQNKYELKSSKLKSLNPFLDKVGLITVGGRLEKAEISIDKKHPIVIPCHHVTKLLIIQEHIRLLHAGQQSTLFSIRQRYWPIAGRSLVRKIIHNCVTCFRAKPKPVINMMGNLPTERVEPAGPFLNCGVDYAGQVYIRPLRGRGKVTLKQSHNVLFICFATKAVHIELVNDLNTESFLNTMRRVIARRGNIKNISSDNATNFVGAQRELDNIKRFIKSQPFLTKVLDVLRESNIVWHFIPPKSAHHGGLWEGNIRLIKHHLNRIVGNTHLTFEEMYTVLTSIEAILNSRPTTPSSEDPNDPIALTPRHFLIGEPLTTPLEADVTHIKVNRLSQWQRVAHIRQHFWRRWSKDYLHHLQQRSKWHVPSSTTINNGTVVLLREENLPPLSWALGRIIDVHPGTDGIIRVVSVKTNKGVVKRAVTKVCVLPMDNGY